MKKLPYSILALLLALTLTVQAKDTSDASMSQSVGKAAPYFDPATFDLKAIKALLPDPPRMAPRRRKVSLI